MRALNRKLLRDLWGMKGQAVAIALVMVAGVSTYVAMSSVTDTLVRTLDTYYATHAFPDGFAALNRAPERLRQDLARIEGMNQVQTRVTATVQLEVPGFGDPVSGTLVGIEEGRQPVLNQLFLREGRLVRPGREEEVVLNEAFAEVHGLGPGDSLVAIVNGRRRALTVTGIALSPEFLMQVQPGALFPDPERYGVLWMGQTALAAAYDMQGAFNDLAFTLAPGAHLDDVLDRVDALLDPYGGLGAYGREDHPSHFLISEELNQLQAMSTVLPTIFLAVAAFLLNIVVTRLISLQREQIAVLKAFGYRNLAVGWHYLKLVLAIAGAGVLVGSGLGLWLGRGLAALYLQFFHFPFLDYTLRPQVVTTAALLTSAAASVGVVQAIRRAVVLPPAEAMRPAPPPTYRATLVERMGLQRFFDQPTRMILRSLERQPIKAGLTVLGMASATAILVMGLFWEDAIDEVIAVQYGLAQREDITVTFVGPTSTAAIHELAALPGVWHAEPFRSVPVRLRFAHRGYDTVLQGIPADATLQRILDRDLRPIPIPEEGLLLTDRLAEILGVTPGQRVTVEILEGTRAVVRVPVVALAEQYLGLGAYMELSALNRAVGDERAISGALLTVDPRAEDQVNQALMDRPQVAAITSQERAIRAYLDTAAGTILTFTLILTLFAGVIAFGVIYNSVRISLSERDRELASLRVLGFERGEVAYILIGELAVLVLLSLPLGFVLGVLGSAGAMTALETEMYSFPVVFSRRTFATAALVVLAAGAVSAGIVRYRLDRLDLVGVLKSRE